jgi:RNA-directed DNA polymerase
MTFRRKTAEGPYEAINYHRFADHMLITITGHWSKRGWAERATFAGAIGNPAD